MSPLTLPRNNGLVSPSPRNNRSGSPLSRSNRLGSPSSRNEGLGPPSSTALERERKVSSETRVNHTDKQLPLTNVAVHLNTDIIFSLSPADSEQLERESPQSILTVDLGNMDGVRMNEAPTPMS